MLPPYGSADLMEAVLLDTRSVEANAQAAGVSFTAWARELGVRQISWQVIEGHLPEALAHVGNWHDLLVLERNDDAPWGSPSNLATLVLQANLPTIVLPASFSKKVSLDCMALAWNGAPESIRAIHAAIPLLTRVRRIVLLSGHRRDPHVSLGWKPDFEIADHLQQHGINCEQQLIEADDKYAGEALLEAAAVIKADMLVMGAYGRSRFSEWTFGGATRHVLANANIAVFMRH